MSIDVLDSVGAFTSTAGLNTEKPVVKVMVTKNASRHWELSLGGQSHLRNTGLENVLSLIRNFPSINECVCALVLIFS